MGSKRGLYLVASASRRWTERETRRAIERPGGHGGRPSSPASRLTQRNFVMEFCPLGEDSRSISR